MSRRRVKSKRRAADRIRAASDRAWFVRTGVASIVSGGLTTSPVWYILSRRRSEFIRAAIRRALWELEELGTAQAYARQPDSAKEAYLDNIHVVPLDRVGELVGVLLSARHAEVKRAVGYAFDWPELKVLRAPHVLDHTR